MRTGTSFLTLSAKNAGTIRNSAFAQFAAKRFLNIEEAKEPRNPSAVPGLSKLQAR